MRHIILAIILASVAVSFCAAAHADGLGDALAASYRAAHEAGDVEALKALVDWKGATDYTRRKITERLKKHLGEHIEDIHFRELRGDEHFDVGRYSPNLKPVGWLIVKFKSGPDDILPPAVSFVVGEMDGKYMITVAEKVK